MSIYSEIPSYVYKHTNILTGEFYFGYRFRNTKLNLIPEDDLPHYVCSSKIKKRIIEERNIWKSEILFKFYGQNKKSDAFWKEQELIKQNYKNKLNLNKRYFDKEKNNSSKFFDKHSEESKKKISNKLKNRTFSEETRKKISDSKKGIPRDKETKEKISNTLKGNIPHNKGKKTGPQSDEVRKKTSEVITEWWKKRKMNQININV